MSTYSPSRTVAIPQSAEEGAAFAGAALSLPTLFLANGAGLFASLAWVGFGVSCLLWEDLGDWSRTHGLAVAAFMIAGVIFAVMLSGSLLGRFGSGLRKRAFHHIWAAARIKPGGAGNWPSGSRLSKAPLWHALVLDHNADRNRLSASERGRLLWVGMPSHSCRLN